MRAPTLAALVLLALALAGCLGGTPSPPPAAPLLTAGGVVASGPEPLYWEGGAAPDRIAFEAWFPEGYWRAHAGSLEVSIDAPGVEEPSDFWQLVLRVTLPDGSAREVSPSMGAATLLLESPASGPYRVEVERRHGTHPYRGVLQVEAWPLGGPPHDLQPNLVALAPNKLQVGPVATRLNLPPCLPPDAQPPVDPCPGPFAVPPAQHGAARGCDLYEAAEEGARRCLRFGNAVGNVGPGAFEIHLSASEGAGSFAGDGQWVQRIHRTDGTWRDVPAGAAAWHQAHLHFHHQEVNRFDLYAYDWDQRQRGGLVKEGQKTGFCLADTRLLALGLPRTEPARFWTDRCLGWDARSLEGDWFSGLGANWFDRYVWGTNGQHLEITGVPDGVYELVTSVNPGRAIQESRHDDNEGSVVFRLAGDAVEVLAEHSGAPAAPPGRWLPRPR